MALFYGLYILLIKLRSNQQCLMRPLFLIRWATPLEAIERDVEEKKPELLS
jgi:hypothetical protein